VALLAKKEAIIKQLQENATNQAARFHTVYAHMLAAMDSLECFHNPDYQPIITVLKMYEKTMPAELIEQTLQEKIAIKKSMAPKSKSMRKRHS
jgi:DNA recombination-dependent growth factor C